MRINRSGATRPERPSLLLTALGVGLSLAACSRWDPSGRAPAATNQQVAQAAPPTTIIVQSPTPPPAAPAPAPPQASVQAPAASAQAQATAPVACGKNTCKGGEVCCSEACGVCAAPGSVCPQNITCPGVQHAAVGAAEQPRDGVACGSQVCRRGEVCCNPSCGICAGPDDSCSQRVCDARDTFEKKQEADLKVGQ